jgi:hypothetical protein
VDGYEPTLQILDPALAELGLFGQFFLRQSRPAPV